ncbi:hypothetical protein GCM10010275_08420 [Streptomyces litmocidini]|uniref:DUF6083 domain-containing protein n=1 Tax=Streptomyces litmocidini TaxID=67318 RepID=UPI00167DFA5D|nr:DUF6083 domain-containing protein [Streptomyces litmocidini]GGU76304.1 hypothetical protein GCM10010275_08420 [Streptomyces litmocidini]
MVAGRRSAECDSCGTPYGTWVTSLGMTLCAECERTGAAHPERDPVLVGDVLAGLVEVVAQGARVVAQRTRPGSAVRDEAGPVSDTPDARAPVPAVCDRCGALAEWHRTARGRWVMIEPGELTARLVPAGRRWRVGGDGTAVDLGAAVPSDGCRVSHFDVCPARPAPADSPVMLALWRSHARRTA